MEAFEAYGVLDLHESCNWTALHIEYIDICPFGSAYAERPALKRYPERRHCRNACKMYRFAGA